jgi:hypothetical protein
MEINIGSDIFRNTSGVLSISGKNQIFLEIGGKDQRLLVSMDLYDRGGRHEAKLKRNVWVFNNGDLYRVTPQPLSLRIINADTDESVVEIRVVDQNKVKIPQGKFYTHQGTLLEITPGHWKIGELTMSGNTIDSCGSPASIG